jgi:hypothetical protein
LTIGWMMLVLRFEASFFPPLLLAGKPNLPGDIFVRKNSPDSKRRLRTLICLGLSDLSAKQGMLPLLAHGVQPCLVYGELSEVGRQAASCL